MFTDLPLPELRRHRPEVAEPPDFDAYGGDPIEGWLLASHDVAPHHALHVEYDTGGRGDPLDWLAYGCAGHVHFVMDTRGQGGGWRAADLADEGAPAAATMADVPFLAHPRRAVEITEAAA